MKTLFTTIVALALASVMAPAADRAEDIVVAVAMLRNSDVKWDGNTFGLVPSLSDRAEVVGAKGEAARSALLAALKKNDSFVVAHVLLTKISNEPYSVSASHWNMLRVELYADGRTRIDNAQKERLVELWEKAPNQSAHPARPSGPRK